MLGARLPDFDMITLVGGNVVFGIFLKSRIILLAHEFKKN
jgi:hypothetical protein